MAGFDMVGERARARAALDAIGGGERSLRGRLGEVRRESDVRRGGGAGDFARKDAKVLVRDDGRLCCVVEAGADIGIGDFGAGMVLLLGGGGSASLRRLGLRSSSSPMIRPSSKSFSSSSGLATLTLSWTRGARFFESSILLSEEVLTESGKTSPSRRPVRSSSSSSSDCSVDVEGLDAEVKDEGEVEE